MPPEAEILARGPWAPESVSATWTSDVFEPSRLETAEADRVVAALADRGSPAHDGLAARLTSWRATPDGVALELQPMRWSLRLGARANDAMTALCVVRDHEGRWLAGRRAAWVASWAGRWALGAGGSVEVDENPVETMTRELTEEWGVEALELSVEALLRLPSGLAMLIGQARLGPGAQVVPDDEHDEYAWWPPEPSDWPDEADEALLRTARMLLAG